MVIVCKHFQNKTPHCYPITPIDVSTSKLKQDTLHTTNLLACNRDGYLMGSLMRKQRGPHQSVATTTSKY